MNGVLDTAHRNNVQIFKCELGLRIGVHIHVENEEIRLKARHLSLHMYGHVNNLPDHQELHLWNSTEICYTTGMFTTLLMNCPCTPWTAGLELHEDDNLDCTCSTSTTAPPPPPPRRRDPATTAKPPPQKPPPHVTRDLDDLGRALLQRLEHPRAVGPTETRVARTRARKRSRCHGVRDVRHLREM